MSGADDEKVGQDEQPQLEEAFQALSELERGFAEVELKHLRGKEFDLKPLYSKRSEAFQKIPDFWPTVFLNPPEEVGAHYSPRDLEFFSALTSFSVERYGIESHDKGEPRSLRFTFEFAPNNLFEDSKLVKEFEYVTSSGTDGGNEEEEDDDDDDDEGALVSTPVPIKWKNKKNDPTDGVLDAAVELYQAEQAMTLNKPGGKTVEMVERQGLWQYEKLREKLAQLDESSEEPSFTLWFGFRGAVAKPQASEKKSKSKSETANGKDEKEDEEDEDEDDDNPGFLDVEVFPAGEDVAIALAEDVWPDAIDLYMKAKEESPDMDFSGFGEEDDDEEDDEGGEDAPELVSATKDSEEVPARPAKRRRNN